MASNTPVLDNMGLLRHENAKCRDHPCCLQCPVYSRLSAESETLETCTAHTWNLATVHDERELSSPQEPKKSQFFV